MPENHPVLERDRAGERSDVRPEVGLVGLAVLIMRPAGVIGLSTVECCLLHPQCRDSGIESVDIRNELGSTRKVVKMQPAYSETRVASTMQHPEQNSLSFALVQSTLGRKCKTWLMHLTRLPERRLFWLRDLWAQHAWADERAAYELGWKVETDAPCPYAEPRLCEAFRRGKENCADWANSQW